MDENNPWVKLAKMSGKAKRPVDPIKERTDGLVARPEYAIDLERANNGARKNQDRWINWHNSNDSIMASAPDVYRSAEDDEIAEALREDFREYCLVSSTRINYNKRNLTAKVTHYFGSENAEPIVTKVHIPHYNRTPLDTVLAESHGLNYVQTLFDTEDESGEITPTLETLSAKSADQIFFWTPNQDSRKNYSDRSVIFNYYVDDFHVNCNSHPDDGDGISRGVHER